MLDDLKLVQYILSNPNEILVDRDKLFSYHVSQGMREESFVMHIFLSSKNVYATFISAS